MSFLGQMVGAMVFYLLAARADAHFDRRFGEGTLAAFLPSVVIYVLMGGLGFWLVRMTGVEENWLALLIGAALGIALTLPRSIFGKTGG